MNDIDFWEERRGRIRTRKGRWKSAEGEVRYEGYSLFGDLVGKVSYFQVLLLHLRGGPLPERRLADWVEATFIMMSWPDPRIWPMRIGAFAGAVRASPVAGICAGTLAADSSIYGPETVELVTEFLEEARRHREVGGTVHDLVEANKKRLGGKLYAPGFIRPLMKGDERVPHMQALADEMGFPIGQYLEVAYWLDDYLRDAYSEGINLAGYIAAFLRDQGFSVDEIYRLYSLCVNGGVHACYAEAADSEPNSFLPMRCSDVQYVGPARRLIDDKQEENG